MQTVYAYTQEANNIFMKAEDRRACGPEFLQVNGGREAEGNVKSESWYKALIPLPSSLYLKPFPLLSFPLSSFFPFSPFEPFTHSSLSSPSSPPTVLTPLITPSRLLLSPCLHHSSLWLIIRLHFALSSASLFHPKHPRLPSHYIRDPPLWLSSSPLTWASSSSASLPGDNSASLLSTWPDYRHFTFSHFVPEPLYLRCPYDT